MGIQCFCYQSCTYSISIGASPPPVVIAVPYFLFLMEYPTNQFIESSGIWLLKSLCLGLIYKDIFCLDGCKRSFMVCPMYRICQQTHLFLTIYICHQTMSKEFVVLPF